MVEMDRARTALFEEKMISILNHGALNLALAVGYRLGVFDVMAALPSPVTGEEIARRAGLDHRYMQEWLGVMATGGIVSLSIDDSGRPRYFLPPEHARSLTRAAGNSNMAVYTQEIPLLIQCAMAAVEAGFRTGEGVPFSKYPRFQSFMSELSNAKHRQVLVEQFLPQVDGGRMLDRLNQGIRVCDLGCGEGVAVALMARAFPRSVFTGIDNHLEAISTARKKAAALSLDNVTYLLEDAAALRDNPPFLSAFDYICAFDSIHDQIRPLEALQSVRAMLAPGGVFSMVDIDADSTHAGNMDHPMAPFLYTVSLLHCMPVGLNDRGAGLGMMWGRQQAEQLLHDAGFDRVSIEVMDHDPFNVHYLCRSNGDGS